MTGDAGITLSLIIPCYNETANLPLLTARIGETFKRPDIEVVLVDNGSTDGSAGMFQKLPEMHKSIRAVRVDENRGYGFGILAGLKAARGDIIGWTHADMQTDPADALRGLDMFEGAADHTAIFVKGLRYGRSFGDQFFTFGMSCFETALMGKPMRDINAQPTLFHRQFFERWERPPHDFSLDLYAYYQARQTGLEVRRFGVRFGERAHGESHWNVDFRSKVKFIRRTLAYSWNLRTGNY